MILESLVLAQARLGEELLQTPGSTTLQTNGTTKFGEHFSTFDVRTEEAVTYTLGIRHIFRDLRKTQKFSKKFFLMLKVYSEH